MKTKIGERTIYDNFTAGVADHPADEATVYIVFTDKDNEETHMFPMAKTEMEKYLDMMGGAIGKKRIILAGANDLSGLR